ncbi:hypothetical protein [Pedobacter sp. CFBP9032]|uniref:hypothetical protein n=1 Tax=Pedobacter sp. CFBP9032 TaxID=3096539 RepID=UPI002A6B4FDD|nr:hypothetical protein [Pedobacter sp. CFBP9032]MDY0907447.1 hypothetical protein [Pedobacter sp. CFBP9032]
MEKYKKSKGILYVATGQRYIDEVIHSALSCKKNNNYPIALVTDSDEYLLPNGLFDHLIIKRASYSYRDKLLIRYSPFEQTIFMDTDTYVCDKLDDLFRILDFREFAIHQADEGYEFQMPNLSNAMPEFNTGVIAYKLTPNVEKLIDAWETSFETNSNIITDQYHLRKTLYESEVKFAIFSSAYNFIVSYPNFVIQKVKILHGRPFNDLITIADNINNIRHKDAWRRMYYPYNKTHFTLYQNPKNEDLLRFLRFSIRSILGNLKRYLKL